MNEGINQISQSINQSISQSVNQPIRQPMNQLINQSINQPINQSMHRDRWDAFFLKKKLLRMSERMALTSCKEQKNKRTKKQGKQWSQ